MIGPKKLSAIRQDLKRALSASGNDPILWLEDRINTGRLKGSASGGESEVLKSLRRFLEDEERNE